MRMAPFTTGVLLALVMVACTETRIAQPTPEGQMTVLGPDAGFDLNDESSDWVVVGNARNQVGLYIGGPVPVLAVNAGPQSLVAVRKVAAHLLATPYLDWRWNLESTDSGIHPLRVVVGFSSNDNDDEGLLAWLFKPGDEDVSPLPAHDRALTLVWGASALRRGHFITPPLTQDAAMVAPAPHYTVRGGAENTNQWWQETVDLAALYAEAWPGDTRSRVRIAFIGFATAPTGHSVWGRISDIRLSH